MTIREQLEATLAGGIVETGEIADILHIDRADKNRWAKIRQRSRKLGIEVINLGQQAWTLK